MTSTVLSLPSSDKGVQGEQYRLGRAIGTLVRYRTARGLVKDASAADGDGVCAKLMIAVLKALRPEILQS